MVENRPIISAKYRLPVTFGQNWPTLQRSLSAIAELLVLLATTGADTGVRSLSRSLSTADR